jgi:AraC family transcriptional regulator of adaptative response / DNA-3-methyladenine glycosylase II
MVEAVLRAAGPYSLRLTAGTAAWQARLPGERWATACQLTDGRVVVRASCERSVEQARFMLAVDDDTGEFHRRYARDPLIGPAVQRLRGMRTRRKATVTHAVVRGVSGQLIQASRALRIERAIIGACGADPPTRDALARLSPARLTATGLAASRAATLTRLARSVDLEELRGRDDALERLGRERGIGPWTVGVIALQGLGRYDTGLVDDLALVKLLASLRRRWPESGETAELLAPYEEWQGLASVFLLQGFKRGLVRGASMDRARLVRREHARGLA